LAKLGATPAWLFLCSAFTILAFTVIYWVADVMGKAKWFDLIKPAGTGTLLCYLNPDSLGNFTQDLSALEPFVAKAHRKNVKVLFSLCRIA
jgi:hypothetical protein